MTRTEERLADALRASAGRVRDERLRPLPAPEPRAGRHAAHRRAIRAWLTPLAAAASVVLVIGLVLALTGHRKPASPPAPPSTEVTSLPRYFAAVSEFGGGNRSSVGVYAASTGQQVANAVTPVVPGWTLGPVTVAAAPDDRTFYVEYEATHESASSYVAQVWIYRFRITGSGQAPVMTRISGGVLTGAAGIEGIASLAVSPDGTMLALTADTTIGLGSGARGYADKVVVIDLLTGQRSVWQGGLYRTGQVFVIPSLSWAPRGSSLVYLALWCNPPAASNPCTGAAGQDGYRDTQVRSLSPASRGGSLNSGALLLNQPARYPVIAAAIAGPDGVDLTLVVLSGHVNASGQWSRVGVEDVAAGSGALLRVDYSSPTTAYEGQPRGVFLSADPTGRSLLLSYQTVTGQVSGWISQGRFHLLPISMPGPDFLLAAW